MIEIGDIVVYVGDYNQPPWARRREQKIEYIVVSTPIDHHDTKSLHCVEIGDHIEIGMRDEMYPNVSMLRLVRKAHYEKVDS